MKFIKISDTVIINPNMISAVEIRTTPKGRSLIIYADGKTFNCTIPYDEIMPILTALDETKQFFAG
jgi:hypothetical protein